MPDRCSPTRRKRRGWPPCWPGRADRALFIGSGSESHTPIVVERGASAAPLLALEREIEAAPQERAQAVGALPDARHARQLNACCRRPRRTAPTGARRRGARPAPAARRHLRPHRQDPPLRVLLLQRSRRRRASPSPHRPARRRSGSANRCAPNRFCRPCAQGRPMPPPCIVGSPARRSAPRTRTPVRSRRGGGGSAADGRCCAPCRRRHA